MRPWTSGLNEARDWQVSVPVFALFGKQLIEYIARFGRISIGRIVLGKNRFGFAGFAKTQRPDQSSYVVQVLRLFAEPKRQTFHRQQVSGMGYINAQVAQFLESLKAADGTQESLHGVIQPMLRQP